MVITTIVLTVVIIGQINKLINPPGSIPEIDSSETQLPSAPNSSTASDEAARAELRRLPWVKDTFLSPGHMNVGVIKTEKQWDSPMIGSAVCGILRKNGSSIARVRFVDIEKVVREQVPAQMAEVSFHYCK